MLAKTGPRWAALEGRGGGRGVRTTTATVLADSPFLITQVILELGRQQHRREPRSGTRGPQGCHHLHEHVMLGWTWR